VAFDFDGTLAQDASDSLVAIEEVLLRYGVDPASPRLREAIDKVTTDRALIEACVGEVQRDEAYRSVVRLQVGRASALRPLPGVAETLANLRQRYILAVYSGRDAHSLRVALQALGIADLFTHVEGDCGTHPPKPDPSALLAIAAQAQVSVDRCIYVGDRLTDSATAAAAGYHFIAAVWRKDRFPLAGNRCARVSDLGMTIDRVLRGDHTFE
jgi:phosphoglycolate phosphatase